MQKLNGIQDLHCTGPTYRDKEIRSGQDTGWGDREHRCGERIAYAECYAESHAPVRTETTVRQDAVESTGHLLSTAKFFCISK